MAAVTIHSDFGAQEEEEDLPDPGIEPRSPEWQVDSLLSEPPGKPRYADDSTLMGESEEELISLLMRVKEESERAGLKLSI